MKKIGFLALACCVAALLIGCGKAQKAYEEGMELARQGEYEKSLSSFEEAIQADEDEAEYYIGYSMALSKLERYEEAEAQIQTALQDTGEVAEEDRKQLYYAEAMADYGLGDYESALKYCKKALKITQMASLDKDIRYTQAASYYWQAETYCEEQKYKKAQQAVSDGLDCKGGSSVVKRLKKLQVILYEKQNRYTEAQEAAQAYLEDYADDTEMEKELAFIATRMK